MQRLNDDELNEILMFLPISSIGSVLQVNTTYNNLENELFWRRLYVEHLHKQEKLYESHTWKMNWYLYTFRKWCMWIEGKEHDNKCYDGYFNTIENENLRSNSEYTIAYLKRKIPTTGKMRIDFHVTKLPYDTDLIFGMADDIIIRKSLSKFLGYTYTSAGYANSGNIGMNTDHWHHWGLSFEEGSVISIAIDADENRGAAERSGWKRPFGRITFYKNFETETDMSQIGVFNHPDQVIRFCVQYSANDTSPSVTIKDIVVDDQVELFIEKDKQSSSRAYYQWHKNIS
jgi:hypothetical protein